MRIKWMEFKNNKTELEIKKVHFHEDITLLVGLSGAGKTQIINAIEYSLHLILYSNNFREKLLPYASTICVDMDGKEYIWSYSLSPNKCEEKKSNIKVSCVFEKEVLIRDGEVLLQRDADKVYVIGYDKVPQPRIDESLLAQYLFDGSISEFTSQLFALEPVKYKQHFQNYISIEQFQKGIAKREKQVVDLEPENRTINTIYGLSPLQKLYLVRKYFPEHYRKVLLTIRSIFPEVDDVEVKEDELGRFMDIMIHIYGKEISSRDISNGILKTIECITEIMLLKENTIYIIDELENGLGVNCIDALTEIILTERKDIQFIVTSHHPRIINGIDCRKWKLIERDRSIINNRDSESLGICNSKHDAYFNLVNRLEFEGKI